MSVKPILFNTEMVRAILDGRKKLTRRIVKIPNYINQQDDGLYTLFAEGTCYENQHFEEIVQYLKKPYQPGDILYVRETWGHPISLNSDKQYVFRADKIAENGFKNDSHIWYPSIHMPKEAARIWLNVTNVMVERLQEITAESALAEGADKYIHQNGKFNENAILTSFIGIWNSTIKKSDLDRFGWNANPWVWVIEFERCEKPEGV